MNTTDHDGSPIIEFPSDPRRVEPSHVDNSAIVHVSSLGYSRAMTTEVRCAPRWGNAVSMYLRHLRAIDQSPNTVYLRGYQLRTLSQAFRGRDPWTLTQDDVESFMSSLTTAHTTKRSMLTGIRGFYNYGTKRGVVLSDPTLNIPAIPMKPGQPRPAADRDIRDALDHADPRTKLMIYLGAFVGMRRSEIARVHTSDLRENRNGTYSLRILGKGRRERLVPLTPLVAGMIRDTEPGWLFPSWHRGQVNSDGNAIAAPLSPGRVGELISEVLPPGVTPHQLRHRFASSLYVNTNHDIRAVQVALGHSNVNTTQTYTAVPQDSLSAGIYATGQLDY